MSGTGDYNISFDGPAHIVYEANGCKLRIECEPLTPPHGLVVYVESSKRWEPPCVSSVVDSDDLELILSRVEAFCRRYDLEFHTK